MQSLQSEISQRQLVSPKYKNSKDQIFLEINIFFTNKNLVWQQLNTTAFLLWAVPSLLPSCANVWTSQQHQKLMQLLTIF